MFNHNPLASQRPVFLLLLLGQRMIFGFLERGLAVLMNTCQTLISSIRQDLNLVCNLKLAILEKLEMMLATPVKGSRHDFSRFLVSDQLRFLGM
jgi:hypothetical protein